MKSMTQSRSKYHQTAALIEAGFEGLADWEERWRPFATDPLLQIDPVLAEEIVRELAARLRDNFPFFHPDYAGQMIQPPHPIAAAAYAIAQQINPNANALDGGRATAAMELEVVDELASMFGYDPATSIGHLTSSGTIANLEALWVARELQPDKAIGFSAQAHYTHHRVCDVLGVEGIEIPSDARGRMDLDALEHALRGGRLGTIVVTAGSTGLGAVDAIDEILPLARRFGARVHVDAAYGGFFVLLSGENVVDSLSEETAVAFRAIADCDSIVVDPHKRALQPYGCGSVLFRDATVGRFYKHDSAYTYFTSAELHLGEISLECSRAGATAAALWATLKVFPLKTDAGLGPILRKTRAAAVRFANLLETDKRFGLVVEPDLDIVNYYPLPVAAQKRVSEISRQSNRIFHDLMTAAVDPIYLATLRVSPPLLAAATDLVWDQPDATVLRSVFMQPEHFEKVPYLAERLSRSLESPRSSARA